LDQGDKNFAYTLTRSLPDINFPSSPPERVEPAGDNLCKMPLFYNRKPGISDKARIYWWYFRKSFNGFREHDVDLYHLSYQPIGFSSRMLNWLPEFRQIPSIHTIPATSTSHKLNSFVLFANRLVTMSDYGRKKLLSLGLKDVLHIPLGIESAAWSMTSEQFEQSKIQLGIEGKKVLLFPGHYEERYGIDILLSAMPNISDVLSDVVYILACRMRSKEDWDREKQVRLQVEKMGLTHAVKFLQTVQDMKTVISASDVVLMPFITMKDKIDIPTTLLEAMASGKPFIISDIPPMNELVHLEGCQMGRENVGLLHKPGDAGELAAMVLKILGDDSLRLAMSSNGVRLVRKRFDIANVACQYREQYQKLISKSIPDPEIK
jgi:glycosyltransferase involved in cell wall biosynthesis